MEKINAIWLKFNFFDPRSVSYPNVFAYFWIDIGAEILNQNFSEQCL